MLDLSKWISCEWIHYTIGRVRATSVLSTAARSYRPTCLIISSTIVKIKSRLLLLGKLSGNFPKDYFNYIFPGLSAPSTSCKRDSLESFSHPAEHWCLFISVLVLFPSFLLLFAIVDMTSRLNFLPFPIYLTYLASSLLVKTEAKNDNDMFYFNPSVLNRNLSGLSLTEKKS